MPPALDSRRRVTSSIQTWGAVLTYRYSPPPPVESQALFRHVAYPHPALRAHLLLLVGKIRLHRLQSALQETSAGLSGNTPPVSCAAAGAAGVDAPKYGTAQMGQPPPEATLIPRRLGGAAAEALAAALRVSFSRGGHDWEVMNGACMGLVLVYVTLAMSSNGRSDGSGRAAACDGGGGREDSVAIAHADSSLSGSSGTGGSARDDVKVGWGDERALRFALE